jgi:hypothetical protein
MQRTSTQAGGLRGACPLEEVTGETVNISEYLNFGFYDQLSFKENAGLGVTSIGRWLGVSHRVGGLILYWVLTMQGTVISPTTVQRVTNLEKETDEVKAAVIEFEGEISHRFKEEEDLAYDGAKPNPEDWSEYLQYDPDFQQEFDNIVNDPGILEADKDFTPDVVYGTYLNMELAIPRDSDGPKFALIAGDMFAQVSDEGNRHVLFEEIIDHRTDRTKVKQQDAFLTTRNGGNYERMGDPHPMKGRQYYLGLHERHQKLIFGAACWECDAETNRGRACICVVDSTCSAETEPNHRKTQDQILGQDSQVWNQDPKDRQRGKSNRQSK